jgi:hypothetical protein
MDRDLDYLKHLLELEYEHSRSAIDKFDDYRARLKGWMITATEVERLTFGSSWRFGFEGHPGAGEESGEEIDLLLARA